MRSLQVGEARARAELLSVTAYDVTLDLSGDDATFSSLTVVRLTSGAGRTFLDLKPVRLGRITLDGLALDPEHLVEGRFPLDLAAGDHELVVEATMGYRNDGEGMHRAHDPADGLDYCYVMSFLDAAPRVFACFDQPDLKAPYTLHVTAPPDWLVVANAPGAQVEAGTTSRWEFARSRPLSTYFVTVVAGPYRLLADEHDGIPLGISARASLTAALEEEAEELFTLTKASFDACHRLFGIRYPFGSYHQAFVPEFNAGAMENPGCVTLRDSYVFTSRVTRSERIRRATTIAHEMTHQWFGNLVTPRWWDDLWLNESFAEYLGTRVTSEATTYDDAWVQHALTRKNWGLVDDTRPSTHPVAGTGAVDAAAALQDFDGISYAKGSAVLTQLASRVGDEVFLGGVRDHLERHAFGNATMADLFAAWERAGAGDLGPWTQAWLRSPGVDRLRFDRAAGELVRTPPALAGGEAPQRAHTLEVAAHRPGGWDVRTVTAAAYRTPLPDVAEGAPVLLDPHELTWADLELDPVSALALPGLVGAIEDPLMRASVWNTVRNGVHQATLDPRVALDVLCAGLPHETQDAAVSSLVEWTPALLAVLADPGIGAQRLHAALRARMGTATAGSGVQLAALRGVIDTATDPVALEEMLTGDLPAEVALDRDLRWRLVRRLTALDHRDRDALDAELASEPTALSRVDHAWCVAALADPDAKAWAWERFTAGSDVANYELRATGLGLWSDAGGVRGELLAPYVRDYFAQVPATAGLRSGWVLADSAEWFYPLTALDDATVAATEAVCASPDLDTSLRRRLLDCSDEVHRRLRARRRYS